jgi:hypothetical protein
MQTVIVYAESTLRGGLVAQVDEEEAERSDDYIIYRGTTEELRRIADKLLAHGTPTVYMLRLADALRKA